MDQSLSFSLKILALVKKLMFTPELSLLFLLAASLSLHLPSFLKFPNKSQQIDTYLSPPPFFSLVLSVAAAEKGDP